MTFRQPRALTVRHEDLTTPVQRPASTPMRFRPYARSRVSGIYDPSRAKCCHRSGAAWAEALGGAAVKPAT